MLSMALSGLLGLLSFSAHAQGGWPQRPITLIVASGAGSGVDIAARELAKRLSDALKTPIIVDNKPGASGILATQAVLNAAPDGYTLYSTTASIVSMAPALLKSLPYDVSTDIVPISMTAAGGVVLLVNKDFPVKTVQELVDHARANPGLSYGTWAVGSSAHLTTEWLIKQTGTKLTHVPYRQTPQLLTELTAGTLQVGWTDAGVALPFIESGKVRALAVTGVARVPRLPGVPTLKEAGYAFEVPGWLGLFAPKGVPQHIIDRLSAEVLQIQGQPDMIAAMTALNFPRPPTMTPSQFKAYLETERSLWRKIVQEARIQPE